MKIGGCNASNIERNYPRVTISMICPALASVNENRQDSHFGNIYTVLRITSSVFKRNCLVSSDEGFCIQSASTSHAI